MKRIILLFSVLFIFSCNNNKIIELPEIDSSEINTIRDVSPAYLFYDITKQDSVELNRKNLIITTNWLVNVDKRLTLDQAIPSIIFLQDKKRNAKMHRNENAKNYYTCHDKSINNLGFIEFTNIYYHQEDISDYVRSQNIKTYNTLEFNSEEVKFKNEPVDLTEIGSLKDSKEKLFLLFDKTMSFQKYIDYKEHILRLDSLQLIIDNDEFIY